MNNKHSRSTNYTVHELLKEFHGNYSDIPKPTEEQKRYIIYTIDKHQRRKKIIKQVTIGSALVAAGILGMTSSTLTELFIEEESEIGISVALEKEISTRITLKK